MKIETPWSVGDRVWAIELHSRSPLWADVECAMCNGKGGGHIPGTGLWVECSLCKGDGRDTLQGGPQASANSGRITRVTACQVEGDPEPEVVYEFRGDRQGNPMGYRETVRHIFATEVEARECEKAIKAKAREECEKALKGRTILRSNLEPSLSPAASA
jgi:hypothetical protein